MVQTKVKFASFEEYLDWSNDFESGLEGWFELIDGELVEVAPESGLNDEIANRLFFLLVATGVAPLELVRPGKCELQVPVLRSKDSANRYPDLVILEDTHLALTKERLTITLDMPPPCLVVEVLSPGKQNRERDLIRKRDQYATRGIPEYWLIDPEGRTITVLRLQGAAYAEAGVFQGNDRILSPTFPDLALTVEQILSA